VAWVYAPGLPSVQIAPAQRSDRVVPAYLFTFAADGTPVTYRAQTLERTTTTTTDVFGKTDFTMKNRRLFTLDTHFGMSAMECANAIAASPCQNSGTSR